MLGRCVPVCCEFYTSVVAGSAVSMRFEGSSKGGRCQRPACMPATPRASMRGSSMENSGQAAGYLNFATILAKAGSSGEPPITCLDAVIVCPGMQHAGQWIPELRDHLGQGGVLRGAADRG